MPEPFRCRVVTPTESLFDEEVTYANVPAHDGLIGVQHGRAPIVAQLGMGELTLTFADSAKRSFFVEGGFMKVEGEDLIVLAESAEPAHQIAETDARAELAEAESRTVAPDAQDKFVEAENIRLDRQRARAKLRIAQNVRAEGI